jgi:hypothetical protein
MPTLLEVQQAMHVSLVQSHDPAITAFLAEPAAVARLNIYRNTFMTSLTKALRLCYHVVQRLVGEEFFEAAAQLFVTQNPPRAAYLDQYGSDFPEFLRHLQPAASVPYLADMASLEWAVNCALHALDAELLELSKLASVAPDDQYRVRLVAHPSVRLLAPLICLSNGAQPAWNWPASKSRHGDLRNDFSRASLFSSWLIQRPASMHPPSSRIISRQVALYPSIWLRTTPS